MLGQQLVLSLRMSWVRYDAVHRTDFDTLWLIEEANAFGTFARIYFIDLFAHVYGLIRAFGFANVTVDTFISNHQCHR